MNKNNNRLLKQIWLLAAFIFSTPAPAAFTYNNTLTWQTLHSEHFLVHYHDGEESLAHKVANISERVHARLSDYFRWQPADKTDVVVLDAFDITNGYTSVIPDNHMVLYMAPPDDLGIIDNFDDWLELLIVHEYTHVLHLDKASGIPKSLRGLFGRLPSLIPALFPAVYQPRWVQEGLATYIETDEQLNVGRGQDALYRAYMRLDVAAGVKPINQVNQPMTDWPLGTTAYLYGVYFFQFIRDVYGEQAIKRYIDEYSDNWIPYSINKNSRHVFGKNLTQLWSDYQRYLAQRFQSEIDQLRADGIIEGTPLTDDGYLVDNPLFGANAQLFYIRNDFTGGSLLTRQDSQGGQRQTVTRVYGDRFDLSPQHGILLAQQQILENTFVYTDLYQVNPNTGKQRQLTKKGRYRFAAWRPQRDEITAVHYTLGQNRLEVLNLDGSVHSILRTGKADEIFSQISWSEDGRYLLLNTWNPQTRWDIELYDSESKTWSTLLATTSNEAQARFAPSGDAIVFSADFDGIYNVYSSDLSGKNLRRLTRVLGGAFSPALSKDGSLLVYRNLTHTGYRLFELPMNSKALPQINLPTDKPASAVKVARQNDNHSDWPTTKYTPWHSLAPQWWFPIIYPENSQLVYGFTTSGSDILDRHYYGFDIGYGEKSGLRQMDFFYVYDRFNPAVKLGLSNTQTDVLNGDMELVGYDTQRSLFAELVYPLLSLQQQASLHLGYELTDYSQHDLDLTQIGEQNQVQLAGLGLRFNSSKYYPRAIGPQQGITLKGAAQDYINDQSYSGNVYYGDLRIFSGLSKYQSLAGRLALGWANKTARLFHLGGPLTELGEGVNEGLLYNHPGELFGKRHFALRGYAEGLPALMDRRMALASLEWRFLAGHIERGLMIPPVGLHRVHGKFFFDAGSVWHEQFSSEEIRRGAGIELHMETVFFYSFLLDLRIGLAKGFDTDGELQSYWTIGASY